MSLPFIPSDAGLLCLQAGCVLGPRVAPGVGKLDRFHGRAWAIVPVASIVGVIFAIRYVSDTANWLTWLALIAVPLGSVMALGWCMHGPRAWYWRVALALLVIPLFLKVYYAPHSLTGEACGAILSGLSCVTLGVLLAAVAPSGWLKVGIVAMSVADVWLVASDLLQSPNNALNSASPGHAFGRPLPQLQSESFGQVSLGYGDLFVAGVFGALLSDNLGRQGAAAVLTLALSAVFDLLFFFVNELPATVPVAVALILMELWALRDRRRARRIGQADPPDPGPPGGASAWYRRWKPAGATPRRAT